LGDVDDNERLSGLDSRNEREHYSAVRERNVERSENHRTGASGDERGLLAGTVALEGRHDYSGWSSQRGASCAVRRNRRRQNGRTKNSQRAIATGTSAMERPLTQTIS